MRRLMCAAFAALAVASPAPAGHHRYVMPVVPAAPAAPAVSATTMSFGYAYQLAAPSYGCCGGSAPSAAMAYTYAAAPAVSYTLHPVSLVSVSAAPAVAAAPACPGPAGGGGTQTFDAAVAARIEALRAAINPAAMRAANPAPMTNVELTANLIRLTDAVERLTVTVGRQAETIRKMPSGPK